MIAFGLVVVMCVASSSTLRRDRIDSASAAFNMSEPGQRAVLEMAYDMWLETYHDGREPVRGEGSTTPRRSLYIGNASARTGTPRSREASNSEFKAISSPSGRSGKLYIHEPTSLRPTDLRVYYSSLSTTHGESYDEHADAMLPPPESQGLMLEGRRNISSDSGHESIPYGSYDSRGRSFTDGTFVAVENLAIDVPGTPKSQRSRKHGSFSSSPSNSLTVLPAIREGQRDVNLDSPARASALKDCLLPGPRRLVDAGLLARLTSLRAAVGTVSLDDAIPMARLMGSAVELADDAEKLRVKRACDFVFYVHDLLAQALVHAVTRDATYGSDEFLDCTLVSHHCNLDAKTIPDHIVNVELNIPTDPVPSLVSDKSEMNVSDAADEIKALCIDTTHRQSLSISSSTEETLLNLLAKQVNLSPAERADIVLSHTECGRWDARMAATWAARFVLDGRNPRNEGPRRNTLRRLTVDRATTEILAEVANSLCATRPHEIVAIFGAWSVWYSYGLPLLGLAGKYGAVLNMHRPGRGGASQTIEPYESDVALLMPRFYVKRVFASTLNDFSAFAEQFLASRVMLALEDGIADALDVLYPGLIANWPRALSSTVIYSMANTAYREMATTEMVYGEHAPLGAIRLMWLRDALRAIRMPENGIGKSFDERLQDAAILRLWERLNSHASQARALGMMPPVALCSAGIGPLTVYDTVTHLIDTMRHDIYAEIIDYTDFIAELELWRVPLNSPERADIQEGLKDTGDHEEWLSELRAATKEATGQTHPRALVRRPVMCIDRFMAVFAQSWALAMSRDDDASAHRGSIQPDEVKSLRFVQALLEVTKSSLQCAGEGLATSGIDLVRLLADQTPFLAGRTASRLSAARAAIFTMVFVVASDALLSVEDVYSELDAELDLDRDASAEMAAALRVWLGERPSALRVADAVLFGDAMLASHGALSTTVRNAAESLGALRLYQRRNAPGLERFLELGNRAKPVPFVRLLALVGAQGACLRADAVAESKRAQGARREVVRRPADLNGRQSFPYAQVVLRELFRRARDSREGIAAVCASLGYSGAVVRKIESVHAALARTHAVVDEAVFADAALQALGLVQPQNPDKQPQLRAVTQVNANVPASGAQWSNCMVS